MIVTGIFKDKSNKTKPQTHSLLYGRLEHKPCPIKVKQVNGQKTTRETSLAPPSNTPPNHLQLYNKKGELKRLVMIKMVILNNSTW